MSHERAEMYYDYTNKTAELYSLLQDKQSKELFEARLNHELKQDMDTAMRLVQIAREGKESDLSVHKWRELFLNASAQRKKVILYGAGVLGQTIAAYILNSEEDFFAFCDKNKHGKTICGKAVLPPSEIAANPDSYAVLICSVTYQGEIGQFLKQHGFPEDSIATCLESADGDCYFEFPQFFRRGTAFIDAGCYDGTDIIRFSKWCNGSYSKIFAFEPDKANYLHCKDRLSSLEIPNVSLFQAGLSNISGEAIFAASSTAGSYIISTNQDIATILRPEAGNLSIQTVALDDLADVEVGMIKMDIEGAEFDALHGAQQVIQRDRPLLSICVYHRRGDMLAIMNYLHELVPEYRFWLRHYGPLSFDTVLYAAV